MEHPCTVVLHLCLDEVKVPGLVVSNAHVQLAGHRPVGSLGVRPERREMSVNTWGLRGTNSEGTEQHQVLFVILFWENIHLILDIDILLIYDRDFLLQMGITIMLAFSCLRSN